MQKFFFPPPMLLFLAIAIFLLGSFLYFRRNKAPPKSPLPPPTDADVQKPAIDWAVVAQVSFEAVCYCLKYDDLRNMRIVCKQWHENWPSVLRWWKHQASQSLRGTLEFAVRLDWSRVYNHIERFVQSLKRDEEEDCFIKIATNVRKQMWYHFAVDAASAYGLHLTLPKRRERDGEREKTTSELQPGDWCIAKDFENGWYEATVLLREGSTVFVKFHGWELKWCQWLSLSDVVDVHSPPVQIQRKCWHTRGHVCEYCEN